MTFFSQQRMMWRESEAKRHKEKWKRYCFQHSFWRTNDFPQNIKSTRSSAVNQLYVLIKDRILLLKIRLTCLIALLPDLLSLTFSFKNTWYWIFQLGWQSILKAMDFSKTFSCANYSFDFWDNGPCKINKQIYFRIYIEDGNV